MGKRKEVSWLVPIYLGSILERLIWQLHEKLTKTETLDSDIAWVSL